MLKQVQDAYGNPMDTSGVPGIQSSAALNPYQQQIDTAGLPPELNTAGLPELFGANDLQSARQQVQDALYQRQAAYLDPQYKEQEEALRTRLANQGFTDPRNEGYTRELDRFGREKNFAYDRAREAAITGGRGEMESLSGISRANRGQLFGERAQARAQGFDERALAGEFANRATGAGNQEAFNNADLNNRARAAALEQMIRLRNQPLNEFNALRSSTQISDPQFSDAADATTNPADMAGYMQNQYNANLNIWNARQQARNSMLSGLMGLGGNLGSAAIGASDRRLKCAITRIGELDNGLPLYRFRYVGGDTYHIGVMADEVEAVIPEAVSWKRGFAHVNYTMLGVPELAGG